MDEYVDKLTMTHRGRVNVFVVAVRPETKVAIDFMDACENDDEFFEYYIVERPVVYWEPIIFLKHSFLRLSTRLLEQYMMMKLVMLRYFDEFAGYSMEITCKVSQYISLDDEKKDYYRCEFCPVFEGLCFILVVDEHKDIVMKFLSDIGFIEIYPGVFRVKISRCV